MFEDLRPLPDSVLFVCWQIFLRCHLKMMMIRWPPKFTKVKLFYCSTIEIGRKFEERFKDHKWKKKIRLDTNIKVPKLPVNGTETWSYDSYQVPVMQLWQYRKTLQEAGARREAQSSSCHRHTLQQRNVRRRRRQTDTCCMIFESPGVSCCKYCVHYVSNKKDHLYF